MSIHIENVSRRFGNFVALDKVSVEVPSGALMALLGPSGSGKSTLLRIIAGLDRPDEGRILFDGEDATRRDLRERKVGFVFQHYALFRHMTVFDNVAFGLTVRAKKVRPSKEEIAERVQALLKLVKLEGLEGRYPTQLSGGQRQRVGLARALAVEPKVLLLDEPFGALDTRVRKDLRRWLRDLHEHIQVTSIFVTHDQEEALELGHQIVVMNHGKVEQSGTPEEVYEKPKTAFVCEFLGEINRFHGAIQDGRIRMGGGEGNAVGYVRPHELRVSRLKGGEGTIEARVDYVARVGPLVRLEMSAVGDGRFIEAHISKDRYLEVGLKAGERVYLTPDRVRVFEDYSI